MGKERILVEGVKDKYVNITTDSTCTTDAATLVVQVACTQP